MVLLRDSVNLLPLPIEGFRAGTTATDFAALAEKNAKSAEASLKVIQTQATAAKNPAAKAKAIATMKSELVKIKQSASYAQQNAAKVTDLAKKTAALARAKSAKAAKDAAAAIEVTWAKDLKASAGTGTTTTGTTTPPDFPALAEKNAKSAEASLKVIQAQAAAATAAKGNPAAKAKAIATMKSELVKIKQFASFAQQNAAKVTDPAKKTAALARAKSAKAAKDAAAKIEATWAKDLVALPSGPLLAKDPVAQAKLDSESAAKAAQTAKSLLSKTISATEKSVAEDHVSKCKAAAQEVRKLLEKIRAAIKANPTLAAKMAAYEAAAKKYTTEAEGYAAQAKKIAEKLPPSVIVSKPSGPIDDKPSGPSAPGGQKTQAEILAEIMASLAKANAGNTGNAGVGNNGNGGNPQTGGVNMGGGGGGMYPGAFLGGGGVGAVSGGAMLSGQGILYPNGGYVGYPQLGAVTSAYVPPPAGYMADQWPPLQTTSYGLTPPCSQDIYISPNSAFAGPPLGSSQQFYGQNLPAQAGPQSMTLIPPSPAPRVTSGAPPARPDLDPIPDGPAYIQQS